MLKSKSELKIISLYILLFSVLLFLVNKFFMPGILASANFLNWDAEHYSWIKDNGYEGFRVAFFPLFPFNFNHKRIDLFYFILYSCQAIQTKRSGINFTPKYSGMYVFLSTLY